MGVIILGYVGLVLQFVKAVLQDIIVAPVLVLALLFLLPVLHTQYEQLQVQHLWQIVVVVQQGQFVHFHPANQQVNNFLAHQANIVPQVQTVQNVHQEPIQTVLQLQQHQPAQIVQQVSFVLKQVQVYHQNLQFHARQVNTVLKALHQVQTVQPDPIATKIT